MTDDETKIIVIDHILIRYKDTLDVLANKRDVIARDFKADDSKR